ncbi:autotransporter assembly complex protein TamA [Nevskia ramosa]|uniref:autotransporter assembly complex protein TamA n=1 Tax=Nevskia ramosa TaxID=64002 RepID=UPI0009FDAC1C|nr:autotransporter assembly complex family protein [Nevskia ramosa]
MPSLRAASCWPRLGWLAGLVLLAAAAPVKAGVDVRVRNLGPDERNNAYAKLSILEYAKRIDADKGEYDTADVERLFKQGEREILSALQPFGWYNAKVTAKLEGAKPDWVVEYQIDAGQETAISLIDFQIIGDGAEDPPLNQIKNRPRPLKLGERIKHEEYETLKTRIVQTAYSLGLLDAKLTRRELKIDVPNNSAEILLTLDSGRRYQFGEISIEQEGGLKLRDAFLRNYLTFEPGENYDPAKVLSTQFAFSDLDYFQTVDIEGLKEKADEDGRIPMVINTTERAPRSYRYGLGYGTDSGPRASVGADFRRINSLGHKLRTDLRVSPRISTAVAEYRVPFGHLPSDSVSFTTQALTQDFSDIKETLYRIGTSYNRRGKTWQRRVYLEYTFDEYSIKESPRQRSKLLVPGISLDHTEGDDPIFPRRGWYAFTDLHGGSDLLLSDTNFVQGMIKLRGVLDLARRLFLRVRVDQGATWVGSFNNLPPSQRFFAGGDGSVRGYSYQSLGPRDANGRVIGGRYLTTASAELDWYFLQEYGVAAFVDAGDANDKPLVDPSVGAGLGFRYRAPFGAFALDLAHPFDPGSPPVRLHLGVQVGL